MKVIIIKSQSELDNLPGSFDEHTAIEIMSKKYDWIYVKKSYENATVEAWEAVAQVLPVKTLNVIS